MASTHHRLLGRVGPCSGSDDVANRIDSHVETEVAHPGEHEIAAGFVVVGQRETGATRLAVGTADRSDLAEISDPTEQTIAVDTQQS